MGGHFARLWSRSERSEREAEKMKNLVERRAKCYENREHREQFDSMLKIYEIF